MSSAARDRVMRLAPVLALTAACSFGLPGPPKPPNPRVMPACTSSRTKPVVDASIAVLTEITGGVLLVRPRDCSADNGSCDEYAHRMDQLAGSILVLTGVIFGVSALFGISRTGSCRDAIHTHERWRATQPAP